MDFVDGNYIDVEEIEKLKIKIVYVDGEKCERCWKYDELGIDLEYFIFCLRCVVVLK